MPFLLTKEDIECLKDSDKILIQSVKNQHSIITCFMLEHVINRIEVEHEMHDTELLPVPDHAALLVEGLENERVWKTILSILQEKDTIKVHWGRGSYTTSEMLEHDLAGDSVEIEIINSERRLFFLLLVHVAPKKGPKRIFQFNQQLEESTSSDS